MRFQYIDPSGKASILGRRNVYVSRCDNDTTSLNEYIQLLARNSDDELVYWYDPQPQTDMSDEEFKYILLNMQLCVFIVSNEMLCGKKRQILQELRFAREQHLPCLPIITKGGDVGEYPFKFGGLPCLRMDEDDFEEQLAGLLKELTGTKQLAERIKASQTFSIFLSCPDKDLHKAVNVARLIHSFDLYRRVRVLTGDFLGAYSMSDEERQQLIKQCDGAIICITAETLNEKGKQLSVEYPAIIANEKPYIMIKLEDIKTSRLERLVKKNVCFVDFPDEQAMRSALETLTGDIGVRRDPAEHRYLNSLAYLFGVGVECDYSFALEQLTAAGEQNHTVAIRQLATMYRNGFGVEQNSDRAAVWLHKLADQVTAEYNRNRSVKNAASLAEVYNSLAESFFESARTDRAENITLRVRELCEKILSGKGSEPKRELMLQHAKCCDILGKIYQKKGNHNKAEECFLCSIDVYNRLIIEKASLHLFDAVAHSYESLGDIYSALKSYDAAERNYRRAYEKYDHIANEVESVTSQRSMVGVFGKLAQTYQCLAQEQRAYECCLNCVDIMKKLAEQTKTIQSRRELADAYSRLGLYKSHAGDAPEAERLLGISSELRQLLVDETASRIIQRELAGGYDVIGNIKKDGGDNEAARKYYLNALDVYMRLVDNAPNVAERNEAKAAEAEACCRAATIDSKSSESRELLYRAVGLWNELYESTGLQKYKDSAAAARASVKPTLASVLGFTHIRR